MNRYLKSLLNLFLVSIVLFSCSDKELPVAATILKNGNIYTVDENNMKAEAIAILGDRILDVGTSADMEKYKGENTKIIDLKGKTLTPGFIEGHGHFMGLGYNELNLDLMDVKSYDELVERVEEAVANAKPGEWIVGRGWHQSKWDNTNEKMIKGFQIHDKLSAVSPDNPVYLR
ncbi:amidohydrolase family protein, partial [Fulvivirga sp.]